MAPGWPRNPSTTLYKALDLHDTTSRGWGSGPRTPCPPPPLVLATPVIFHDAQTPSPCRARSMAARRDCYAVLISRRGSVINDRWRQSRINAW